MGLKNCVRRWQTLQLLRYRHEVCTTRGETPFTSLERQTRRDCCSCTWARSVKVAARQEKENRRENFVYPVTQGYEQDREAGPITPLYRLQVHTENRPGPGNTAVAHRSQWTSRTERVAACSSELSGGFAFSCSNLFEADTNTSARGAAQTGTWPVKLTAQSSHQVQPQPHRVRQVPPDKRPRRPRRRQHSGVLLRVAGAAIAAVSFFVCLPVPCPARPSGSHCQF